MIQYSFIFIRVTTFPFTFLFQKFLFCKQKLNFINAVQLFAFPFFVLDFSCFFVRDKNFISPLPLFLSHQPIFSAISKFLFFICSYLNPVILLYFTFFYYFVSIFLLVIYIFGD
uniref:NADH dehydrogenase subunit 6 n=1 Tax=Panagrolaimus sp. PS1159 TaxID=55785 RepID=A0AC35G488_9BILA